MRHEHITKHVFKSLLAKELGRVGETTRLIDQHLHAATTWGLRQRSIGGRGRRKRSLGSHALRPWGPSLIGESHPPRPGL